MKNVVVIGGGTGTYTILRGLKLIPDLKITAIVTSADSGGSTGILRDEFGNLPVGDFRQCLVALADEENNSNNILRELFQYRFSKGDGLSGHSFGNIFLTALTDILGSEEEAFKEASRILNIKGEVFPVTFNNIQLVAEYENEEVLYGEDMIDNPPKFHNCEQRITHLWTQPKNATVFDKTATAVKEANYIIMGPGDLYTSILACIVVDDFSSMIRQSHAKLIYFPNLITKYGQTHNFTTQAHVNEMERYIGRKMDYIFINNTEIPNEILSRYEEEKSYPVTNDFINDKRVIESDLISNIITERKNNDSVKRSLIRHDSEKIRLVLQKILQNR